MEVEGKNEMLHISYTNTPYHYIHRTCIVYALCTAQLTKNMKRKSNQSIQISNSKLSIVCLDLDMSF